MYLSEVEDAEDESEHRHGRPPHGEGRQVTTRLAQHREAQRGEDEALEKGRVLRREGGGRGEREGGGWLYLKQSAPHVELPQLIPRHTLALHTREVLVPAGK
jgi:hypothetical protein